MLRSEGWATRSVDAYDVDGGASTDASGVQSPVSPSPSLPAFREAGSSTPQSPRSPRSQRHVMGGGRDTALSDSMQDGDSSAWFDESLVEFGVTRVSVDGDVMAYETVI